MTKCSCRNEGAGRNGWEKQMQHRRIPVHFFAGSPWQCKAEDGTQHGCSHGRNLCISPAQLCFPWAEKQLSWNHGRASTSGEHSSRGTSHSRALTGCSNKFATICVSLLGVSDLHLLSDCSGVILDPTHFLLLAHRTFCLN